VAVVEEDSHGPAVPHGCDDQIQDVIAVHIARLDRKTARRRDYRNRQQAAPAEAEADRVISDGRRGMPALDSRYVRLVVTVKVGDGVGQAGMCAC
jgi:hypothetical protein